MIFMSQSGITDPARAADWDRWYVEHLKIMLSVNGVNSTQRFKLVKGDQSPSLAMYSMVSAAVFDDPYYLSVRGMGEWTALIDRSFYRRNLFDGLERAPAVRDDQRLLVADRATPQGQIAGIAFDWLEAVAIDKSTPYRGIAVVAREIAERLPSAGAEFSVYQPATPCVTK